MTEEILYHGPVDNIAALIAAFNFTEAFVLLESIPQHVVAVENRQNLLRFVFLSDIPKLDELENYTSGRVFDEDFELRWERVSGKTLGVFLGKKEVYERAQKGTSEWKSSGDTLKTLAPQPPCCYYLFGQLLADDDREQMGLPVLVKEEYYAEARIPRLLPYPIKPDNPKKKLRVQLDVIEYTDNGTGQVKLFRFSGLRPAE
jgi:hypothetical protein